MLMDFDQVFVNEPSCRDCGPDYGAQIALLRAGDPLAANDPERMHKRCIPRIRMRELVA